MCGIAGYIGNTRPTEEALRATLALMRHRGPDHQGFRAFTKGSTSIALLHARLGIIDLEQRSNQPFNLGSHWLIFNGEIYNYVELRKELQAEGVVFSTQSDTEVLAHILQRDGLKGLDRCNGMWAFAWYDERDGSLTLSRDRFGEKPLYYAEEQGSIVFGSEIKFLQALRNRKFSINSRQLYRYLVCGYRALYKHAEGFYNEVREVRPGSWLTFHANGSCEEGRYWTPSLAIDDSMTYDEAVSGAREAIEYALKIGVRSDVPVAFCLSGGVDSTALVSLAKRVFHYDVHGFTVANMDKFYDERKMVSETVSQLGIRHSWVPVETTDFLPQLRHLIAQHDSPVATITFYVQWRMMRMIAEAGYRVVMSGTGADEMFSGYYDHHLEYLYDLRNDPAQHAAALANWKQHVLPLVRNPLFQNANLLLEDPKRRDFLYNHNSSSARYWSGSFTEPFSESEYTSESLLRNRMLNELFHESVPVFLHEDDHNAMEYSLENRSPFLNRAVFDWCRRIPTRHLIHNGKAKAILRDAVRDVAPAQVLNCREKVGFNAPLSALLDLSAPDVREFLLDDGPVFQYVTRDLVAGLIATPERAYAEGMFLFNFINAKIFLENVSS